MKVDRHGKAKILSQAEIQLLFSQGFQTPRDRALFGICVFPGIDNNPTQEQTESPYKMDS